MAKMHADEADVDAALVRQLIRTRFPQWAELPVERLASGGTVNAVYRLGDELTVRLPLTGGGVADLEKEAAWMPRLAPALPVAIPAVMATGVPGHGYPFPWTVLSWIDGEVAVEGRLAAPELVAADLAAFATAMWKIDLAGGPVAHRAGPLSGADQDTREAIEALRGVEESFDAGAALDAWAVAAAAPAPPAPCWVHSDLMPSNLLVAGDRLAAVLDFGTVGLGDPASDLIPAWNLLPASARASFREAVDVDDDTWARGRGWALSMALIQLPYYRNTNPIISANARYVIDQVLADHATGD
jgi:aminoglycoside phosphotransferase (APT) family kinase protein